MEEILGNCRWCGGSVELSDDSGLLQNLAGYSFCSFAPADHVEQHHQLVFDERN
jgi:hypothetical protein